MPSLLSVDQLTPLPLSAAAALSQARLSIKYLCSSILASHVCEALPSSLPRRNH